MRYWYDTEFLEDGSTIEPISIGIVAEDGRELYLVNEHAPWSAIADHGWLVQNVIPHLPQLTTPIDATVPWGGTIDRRAARDLRIDLYHPDVKPLHVIAEDVRYFLQDTDKPIELWGYYSSYDHILLSQLWGRMTDRPAGIPWLTLDIQQEALRLGLDNSLPKQAGNAHNALDDARWTRDAWNYLAGYQTSRRCSGCGAPLASHAYTLCPNTEAGA